MKKKKREREIRERGALKTRLEKQRRQDKTRTHLILLPREAKPCQDKTSLATTQIKQEKGSKNKY